MSPGLAPLRQLESLHMDDECTHGSVDYILDRVATAVQIAEHISRAQLSTQRVYSDRREPEELTPHQIRPSSPAPQALAQGWCCLGNLAQTIPPT